MLPEIDSSNHPYVFITFPEEMELEEIRELGRILMAMSAEKGPYHSVADISNLNSSRATAQHRALMSEVVDELAQNGRLLTEAVIAKNPVLRGLVTAYQWLRGHKDHPFKCVKNRTEAMLFAKRHLGNDPRTSA